MEQICDVGFMKYMKQLQETVLRWNLFGDSFQREMAELYLFYHSTNH